VAFRVNARLAPWEVPERPTALEGWALSNVRSISIPLGRAGPQRKAAANSPKGLSFHDFYSLRELCRAVPVATDVRAAGQPGDPVRRSANIKLGWVAAESGWGRNCLGCVGRQRDRYRRVSCRATLRSVTENRISPDICSVRLHRSPNQIGWAKLLIPAKKWWPPFLGDLS
jgi:hypothetical protein